MPRKRRKLYDGKTRAAMRHAYHFVVNGKKVPVWAKVRAASTALEIILTEQDVLDAIEAFGFGDGQNCAGAICTKRHGPLFSHKFTGYVDWWDHRVFVACRNNRLNMPTHCVAYAHNHSDISTLFDSRKGLEKLLRMVREEGPITIRLSKLPDYVPSKPGAHSPGGDHRGRRSRGHRARVHRAIEGHGLVAAASE